MRIALFTETFLPKVDGIVNTLCYLMSHFADRAHDSILFAPESDHTQYANTPIIQFKGYPFPWYPELKIVPPTVPIREDLEAFQPDIIHVFNPTALGLAGMWHARKLGVPVVASYHTDIPGYAVEWGMPLLRDPIWAILRSIHDRADLNLCPSKATLAELKAQGFKRVKIWTRGVDTTRFHPQHKTNMWRNYLTDGHPEVPLLVIVCRLSPEKRIDWLLPVLEAFPAVRLAIVGDGPARDKLEQLFAHTPTVFTGYLRGHELAQAYAAGDIFVFPSANETLGNVVLEAMASGLPVVAARSGGPLDIVIEGENGLMFDPHDEADLIKAIHPLITNLSYAQQLGTQARRYAETRSWDRVLDGLLDGYQMVIRESLSDFPLTATQATIGHLYRNYSSTSVTADLPTSGTIPD